MCASTNEENPLPPDEDPITSLLEQDVSKMNDQQLDAYVEKLHSVVNNPKELNKIIKGKTKKKKAKPRGKNSEAEDAIFKNLMDGLT